MAFEKFNFTSDFQDQLLACVITHPLEFWTFGDIVRPEYFNGVDAFETAFGLKTYVEKYGNYPNFSTLMNTMFVKFERNNPDKASQLVDYIMKLSELDTADYEGVRELVVHFAKERSLFTALKKIHSASMEGRSDEIDAVAEVEAALCVGEDTRMGGVELKEDYEAVIREVSQPTYGVQTGYNYFDNVWKQGWAPGWLIVPLAPPKSYKCLGKGTGILMFDGSVKMVEDIIVGDLIMGDDSTPRTVTTCGKGHGPLYRVEQSSGVDFVCNDAHILCLKHKNSKIQEMSAETYAAKSKWFHREWGGYKASAQFPEQPVPIDAYFLGLWLGDGTAGEPALTVGNSDPEIATYLKEFASKEGLHVMTEPETGCERHRLVLAPLREPTCTVEGCKQPHRAGGLCHRHYCKAHYRGFRAIPDGQLHWKNPVDTALIGLGIFKNKHIPEVYKINSRNVRLQLLAGLIDSDGNYVNKKGIIFVNTNQALAEGTCWLARSLGFHASIAPYKTSIKSTGYTGSCWHVTITGRLSEIPTKIERKRCKDSVKKYGGRYSIKVKPIGEGNYYGFTIGGNQRFMLADFTVTHNTTFCINLALKMLGPSGGGQDIIYYACEISDKLAMMRAIYNLAGMGSNKLFEEGIEKFIQAAKAGIEQKIGGGRLFFKSFASKTASIADIEKHAKYLIMHKKANPKAIVIDYAETVRPSASGKNVPDWRQQADIYIQARAMGTKLNCCVIMPDRCNKETVGKAVPNMASFQGSFEKAGAVDIAIGICFTEGERLQNKVRYFIFLNRHGPQLLHFEGTVDPELMRMTVDKDIAYVPEDEIEAPRRGRRSRKDKVLKEMIADNE
jgi:hypothetical protein